STSCRDRPSTAAPAARERRPEPLQDCREFAVQFSQLALELAVVEQQVDHLGLGVESQKLPGARQLLSIDVQCLAHFASHRESLNYGVCTICIWCPYRARWAEMTPRLSHWGTSLRVL